MVITIYVDSYVVSLWHVIRKMENKYSGIFTLLFGLASFPYLIETAGSLLPVVVNTWEFYDANLAAWNAIYHKKLSSLESLLEGGTQCDLYRKCGSSVGYGAHPDESGETTLDAMVMDGPSHNVGSVGGLKNIKSAMSVAHAVMLYTTHTLLVGKAATDFAIGMGYKKEDLHTNASIRSWDNWRCNNCQPNYRQNVSPDPSRSCGPYNPDVIKNTVVRRQYVTPNNHDTIGMIVMDRNGHIAAGTTTNGLIFKVPGRVGDSPIVGAGAYVDNDFGAAVATGDGDVMMRFLPSFQTVSYMEQGLSPDIAASLSIKKIIKYYPKFSGALLAINKTGHHGAACHRMKVFPFLVANMITKNTTLDFVPCV